MILRRFLSFHQHLRQKQTSFRFFIVAVLLFALGDGVFFYQVPTWLDSVLHDVALVGIVMSSSSLVGFLCDLSFPTLFAKREYRFFFALTFMIALSTQLLGLLSSGWLVAIIVMALAGCFAGLILTESEAIFEDYVARLHRFSSEMIGLVRSASSLGYIIGPLVAGLLAEVLGVERTLAVIGLLPGIAGIFAFLKIWGKTRLPQQELAEISAY